MKKGKPTQSAAGTAVSTTEGEGDEGARGDGNDGRKNENPTTTSTAAVTSNTFPVSELERIHYDQGCKSVIGPRLCSTAYAPRFGRVSVAHSYMRTPLTCQASLQESGSMPLPAHLPHDNLPTEMAGGLLGHSLDSPMGSTFGRFSPALAQTIPILPVTSPAGTTPESVSIECHDQLVDGRAHRTVSRPISSHHKGTWSPSTRLMSLGITAANNTSGGFAHRSRAQSLLKPLASVQDPDVASAVLEHNRNTLIAELERRKKSLQRQLAKMRKEVSANNIFALVRASNASQIMHLLENKLCDVNKRDYNGCTPLHVAALEGNQAIVRVLISFGADIMATDNIGRTPLDWAAANRHSGVCRYLLGVTQYLLLMQKRRQQEQPQLQFEDSLASTSCTSRGDSVSLRGTGSLVVPLLARRVSPFCNTLMSFANSSTAIDIDTSGEQQNDLVTGDVLAGLPPDKVSLLSAPNAVATDAVSNDEHHDDETDAEGEDNYTSLKFSSYSTISDTVSLVVCMVGLPGRGKSFIAHRLSRYLNWKGLPCRVFNAGNYRRQLLGVDTTAGSAFYDPNNATGKQLRDKMADLSCHDLVDFIAQHRFAVGVFDATNTTKARRSHLVELFSHLAKQRNVDCRVIFIESICTDETIITENILRAKCGNDDFKNVTATSEVIASFRSRIVEYEKVYEPLDYAEDLSFIRIVNVKHHVVLYKVPCGLASRIAFFLLNLHPVAYPIYIALPGETEGDHNHVYGGGERLTSLGHTFAVAMKKFILERYVPHMVVLHGTNPSVLNTLKPLTQALEDDTEDDSDNTTDKEESGLSRGIVCPEELLCPQPGLDSINYGRFCGRTAEWVRSKYAKLSRLLYATSPGGSLESTLSFSGTRESLNEDSGSGDQQQQKPLSGRHRTPARHYFDKSAQAIRRFRHVPNGADPRMSYCVQFPNGESCRQVNVRLEPALMAVMRSQGPVFVLASQVPAQGTLAFFTDVMPEMTPTLRLPRHAVVEIGVKGDITMHQLVESSDETLHLDAQ
ncbi:putative 6-phosphofructo-2-kinase/fructose-2,6-biphosphatase [Trypanosoma grayi]|uniref:putative 6-phosphofructo-2-kinase/fructose-2,6-biphosphatase n=1 Tax=Trypanosoma grayi TaxID=71804 RepID=UPI0004F46E9F|nr:putative 6-phosphofructo-2-kinase/fructose-2,6-biphosphatase [Trypanosoma grayi]KEG14589.1 putative 6-phosphofructo-2-kinase/fructose-2,6-biphosphatase [Trypanosoma grayi]